MSPEERTDGAAGRTVVERPPPGVARGELPAPRSVVLALGAAIVAAGLVYLLLRARKPRNR